MLFVPELACGIGNAAADIIEQTQQADSVSFPDFRRALQRLDQIKGQKAVTEPANSPMPAVSVRRRLEPRVPLR